MPARVSVTVNVAAIVATLAWYLVKTRQPPPPGGPVDNRQGPGDQRRSP